MDLTAVQSTVTAWVEKYSGLPTEWGKLPQKIHTGPFVLAYLGAITKQGHDELIQTYDSTTDLTAVRVVGVRLMTIRLSFRAFDQRLGGSARQYAETFRVALHSDSAMTDLRDNNLALVDTDELVDSDYVWSGRTVSQTDMSIQFGLRAFTPDPNHDGSYIGSVEYKTENYVFDEFGNQVTDEDGNPVVDEPSDPTTITPP